MTVIWVPTALDELAEIWMQGDTAQRNAINTATNLIDEELATDPHLKGESRSKGRRIFFAPPLGIFFKIMHQDMLVRGLHVWQYG